MDRIHRRVRCLTGWLIDQIHALHHSNGRPLAQIYGPLCCEGRGGTVAMNFMDIQGRVFDHEEVERRANSRKISLRTGCFCNPGAGEVALGLSRDELLTCFSGAHNRMTYQDFRGCIDKDGTGAVRVSVGLASNFRDVHAFIQFAREFIDTAK